MFHLTRAVFAFAVLGTLALAADAPTVAQWKVEAAAGNANAQYNLGLSYLTGRGGLPKDPETGFHWLVSAAEQGLPQAQFRAGALLEKGWGNSQHDFGDSSRWYEAITARPDFTGQSYVLNSNPVRAVHFYQLAAKQGYAPAQARLGDCYATGNGVQQDNVSAYVWLSLAAQQSHHRAIAKQRDALARRLSALERTTAEHDLATWQSLARKAS